MEPTEETTGADTPPKESEAPSDSSDAECKYSSGTSIPTDYFDFFKSMKDGQRAPNAKTSGSGPHRETPSPPPNSPHLGSFILHVTPEVNFVS
jgi:hypothetical protein